MDLSKKNVDITLINPFLGATYDIFKQVLNCELRKGQISIKKDPSAKYEIAIIIGISGDRHTGVVVYSMKDYTAKKIVRNLNPEFEMSNYDNEILSDTLGELANMISGNALSNLSNLGINFTITTPSVIVGDAFEMHLLEQTTLSSDMLSPFGDLEINVAIKKF